MAYRTPKDLADSVTQRRKGKAVDDGHVRETFTLPRDEARVRARLWLDRWPAAAYMSQVEAWRVTSEGEIEFTMRRLKSAD